MGLPKLYPKLTRVIKEKSINGIDCYKHLGPSFLTKIYMAVIFNPVIGPILGYFNSKKVISVNDLSNIKVDQVDEIDYSDYPDFCDAYISKAYWINSLTDLTETQLDQLNEYSNFVYDSVQEFIH